MDNCQARSEDIGDRVDFGAVHMSLGAEHRDRVVRSAERVMAVYAEALERLGH